MATVVIDPGHGGTKRVGGSSPNNATGPNGLKEKDVLLEIATEISRRCSADHDVTLTRNKDVNLSLGDRAMVAKNANASVMVSLHFNGFDGSTQGTETFVHPSGNKQSDRLASCLQNCALNATGLRDRQVKKKNLGVLRPSRHNDVTAAALVELSFMDVPLEAIRLETGKYKHSLGDAIMEGINLFLSDPEAWGQVRYTPQNLPLLTRLSQFMRNAMSSDGLEH